MRSVCLEAVGVHVISAMPDIYSTATNARPATHDVKAIVRFRARSTHCQKPASGAHVSAQARTRISEGRVYRHINVII